MISCVKIFKNEYSIGLVSFTVKRSFRTPWQRPDPHKSNDRTFPESVSELSFCLLHPSTSQPILQASRFYPYNKSWYLIPKNLRLGSSCSRLSWLFLALWILIWILESVGPCQQIHKYTHTNIHTSKQAPGMFTGIALNVRMSVWSTESVHTQSSSPKSTVHSSIYLGFL